MENDKDEMIDQMNAEINLLRDEIFRYYYVSLTYMFTEDVLDKAQDFFHSMPISARENRTTLEMILESCRAVSYRKTGKAHGK